MSAILTERFSIGAWRTAQEKHLQIDPTRDWN